MLTPVYISFHKLFITRAYKGKLYGMGVNSVNGSGPFWC
jgi:hypothetical protein